MGKPKIVVEVEGGVVQCVYSDQPIEWILVDWDNIKETEDWRYGIYVSEADVIVDKISDRFISSSYGGIDREVGEELEKLGL